MPGLARLSSEGPQRERGQSNVLGVVLVVGITVLGVTGLMLFGSSAIVDSRTQSEIDAVEHAMTQLDSRFSLVALGSAERQGASMDLQSGSSLTVDGDSGWMNVSIYNDTSNQVEQVVLNTTLGAVRYENDGTTVAYQGGGVWKQAPSGGSVMVSPPEFHYRTRSGEDPTLTLPLVVVLGSGSVPGDATVTKEETIARFPNDSVSARTNPLEGGQINITVHSDYYEAWGAFFESRTGGGVTYDHDREEVRIVLQIEQSDDAVAGGVISGASGELELHKNAEVDSYNSSNSSYSPGGDNSTIISSGSVRMKKDSRINGSLIAGGSVTLQNGATVTGDVTEHADVASPRAVDWLIDERREEISTTNNNDDTGGTISGNSLTCSTCTLESGEYYLDGMDLAGGTLELDTSSGDITIAVDGDMDVEGSTVTVTGDNTTRFYVEQNFKPKNSDVTVSGDRAPGLWVYMNPGANVDMFSQADFTGVVYGPGDGAEAGVDVKFQNNVHIYGALVGDLSDGITQKQHVHFDEALTKEDPLAGHGGDQPTVTYLHVTENRVNVTAR